MFDRDLPADLWYDLQFEEKYKDTTPFGNPKSIYSGKGAYIGFLLRKHKGICHWCSEFVISDNKDREFKSGRYRTVDHLKTIVMGRANYWDGGHVLSCAKCNWTRSINETKEEK